MAFETRDPFLIRQVSHEGGTQFVIFMGGQMLLPGTD